ncbi:MAG: TonB-dependent receptor, partial [Bacteroidota bacterium]
HKMKYFYFSLIALLLLPSLSIAQDPGMIRGKVLSAEGTQLSFATVILYLPDSTIAKTGFTNENGQYILTPLGAGSYFLSIQFTDLGTFRSDKIELAQGQTIEMPDIVLKTAETSMDEVQIVARKPLVEIQPDKTIFNVAGNTNAIGENAFDLLRKAPGVIIDNNDNIVLMGNSGVRIFIDGKPSPLSVADLANMLKGMQSDQIEAIEIITNPSARYDAEGTAGIINIRLKKE